MARPLLTNPSKRTLYMRAWKARHPEYDEYQRVQGRIYRSDPEVRSKAIERAKKWVSENPDRRKATLAEYLPKTRKERSQKSREWVAANREKHRAYQRQYQSGRRAKTGKRKVDLSAVEKRCSGICGICGKPIEGQMHFDHIIPLALGGEHTEDNPQTAHPLCNRLKGAKIGYTIAEARP